ncbi:MAG: signal peptidase [Actinomycetota bacterium]|nr:signal peptidase [Actinomycetota bacterium]
MSADAPDGFHMKPGALVRSYEIGVALTTIVLVLATAAWIRPEQIAVGVIVLLALVCGAAPMVLDAFTRRRTADTIEAPVHPAAPFTTVMRLGSEPTEVARTSIILAQRIGPTVVVTTRRRALLDELGPAAVPVFVAPTIELAIRDAAQAVETDAVIVVSASAFPIDAGARRAAGQLRDDIGWVTGRAPSPNDDRYAPRERELLAERLRASARAAGATLWEPDATVVRTDLLVAHPIEPGRPWGAWLRMLQDLGFGGRDVPEPIAHRAAPADAPGFWPSQLMRTRAAASDLAGARRSGPVRARMQATAALLHELFAWSLGLWALVPLLIGWTGAFPLSCAPVVFVAALACNALARWTAVRLAHGVQLHPVHDTRGAAYDAPGSLLALPSALTRRVHRRRILVPDQPLLWFALALTFATTLLLLERATTSDTGANLAAGGAMVNLVVLWTFAIRAVGERAWDRTVYRLEIDAPATVDGRTARIIEGSPTGCAITGPFADIEVGSTVTVVAHLHEETEIHAVVANRRAGSSPTVLGLALDLDPGQRVAWLDGLFATATRSRDNAGTDRHAPTPRTTRSPARPHAFAFRFEMLLVGAVSFFAASVLATVLLGYRPLVVSSGSMRPALQVGDLVVTTAVSADQLHVGDIVSFDDRRGTGELVTHRVRSVVGNGSEIRVETRGDANAVSEIWDVPNRSVLRRTVLDIPAVGGVVSDLGAPSVRVGLLGGGAALAGVAGYAAIRKRRRTRPPLGLAT